MYRLLLGEGRRVIDPVKNTIRTPGDRGRRVRRCDGGRRSHSVHHRGQAQMRGDALESRHRGGKPIAGQPASTSAGQPAS
eukprot:6667913-Pyramimonas_sp.AAC.1